MATFMLRDVPDHLWTRVKARAKRDRLLLQPLLLRLLSSYAEHGLPRRPARLELRLKPGPWKTGATAYFYDVGGLPEGHRAVVSRVTGAWRYVHESPGSSRYESPEAFESPERALVALRRRIAQRLDDGLE